MWLPDLLTTYGPTVDCDKLQPEHRKDNVVLGKLRPDSETDDGQALIVSGVGIYNVPGMVAVSAGAEIYPHKHAPERRWGWRSMLFEGIEVAGIRWPGGDHIDTFWASGTAKAKDAIDLTLVDCAFLAGGKGVQTIFLCGHWREVSIIGTRAAGMKHSCTLDMRGGATIRKLYTRRSPLVITCKAGTPSKIDNDGQTVVKFEN